MLDIAKPIPVRGRGAAANPKNRFERLELTPEEDAEAPAHLATEYFRDGARSIIAFNDSPDVGFSASLNPYRGCEHGCIYCYARPTHEYLGLSSGLDFETKLFVKEEAPALLRAALASPKWVPQPLGLSGVTDPYQPIERKLQLTRRCLEVLADFRQPVAVITKNHLVTRDIDLLARLAEHRAAMVFLSITTLDGRLARTMEPRASRPQLKLDAVRALAQANIPVGVLMGPVIPGLTDHEIPSILEQAADAGAGTAGYTMLRLPFAVKELFADWLEQHYPLKKDKVLGRLREMRGGRLNDPEFGSRMQGEGIYAETLAQLFAQSRRRFGLDGRLPPLSTAAFRRPAGAQLSLFDG